MKKNAIVFLLALAPALLSAQSIFDKYEDLDEVTSVVVSPGMFDMLKRMEIKSDEPEAKEFIEIAESVRSLKVFTTDDTKIGADMKKTVDRYLKSSKLTELMRVKDKDANVKFYVRQGKDADHVSELLMFVTGLKDVEADGRRFETVLLTLTGDIDLNKVGSLTKKMNLPDELNNVDR